MLAALLLFADLTLDVFSQVNTMQLGSKLIHDANYGEVVAHSCTNKRLTVDTRDWITFRDPDGVPRKFRIDAFATDLAKAYPMITTNNCGRGHKDCPYVKMWNARNMVYQVQEAMREEELERIKDAQQRPNPLFRRLDSFRRRPLRRLVP